MTIFWMASTFIVLAALFWHAARRAQHKVAQLRRLHELHRRALADAEEQRSWLCSSLQQIREACYLLDSKGCFVYANEEAARMLGSTPDRLQGQCAVDLFPDFTSHPMLAAAIRALESRRSFEIEEHHPALGRWFRVRGQASEQGVAVFLRDETEAIEERKALRLGQRAMQACSNGIAIVDAQRDDMPLIYVNRAFTAITGYSADEVLGKNCRFLQSEADRQQPEVATLRQAITTGREANVVLLNRRKDGSAFWNEVRISPVHDETGRITHFVGILDDVTARRWHEADTEFRATHDALTGLPNRTLLQRVIRRALERRPADPVPVAALFIDLDQFKEVNDTLGHDAGDQMLQEAARRIRRCLRQADVLARLGGDEFVAVLHDMGDAVCVARIAERILRSVARPYVLSGQTLFVSCSIGISISSGDATEPEVLLRQADLAMYAAKSHGRNTYHFFDAALTRRANDRLELRTRLQEAIKSGRFELHYQPQIALADNRICGVEALIRWRDPARGLVPPGQFIPLAEETGQIVQIGQWVLDRACAQHREWIEAGLLDCPIAVNVSGLQFQRANFVQVVKEALSRSGLPANRLELEVTESVTMDREERTLETLKTLRELGVRVAIDDFGTGFSSLSYLKRLPVDKVKIDRAFIADIDAEGDDASIALSIIAIAHHLRLVVTAEGVETVEQLNYLRRHCCDEAQGYLFSRPADADGLAAFVREHRLSAQETLPCELPAREAAVTNKQGLGRHLWLPTH